MDARIAKAAPTLRSRGYKKGAPRMLPPVERSLWAPPTVTLTASQLHP